MASDDQLPRRLHIERDLDRARASANDEAVVAVGALYPSGQVIIEWRRSAFEEDDRAEEPVESRYGCIEDAEQATGGRLVFDDREADT